MTLWMTPALRYFLVPRSFPWRDGPDTVSDVLGVTRRVDLTALAEHEVGPDAARAFAEAETRRMEASLDAARPSAEPTPDIELIRAQVAALAEQAGGLDASVQRALAAIGLPVERLVAEPEQTIAMWAEILATVTAAQDRTARERVQGRVEGILTRYGYADAARELRTAPARVRKWAETLARTEATVSTAARIRAVAGAVRGALTDAQAAEVENNVAAGEERLAVEFLVDFLLEAEARVTAAVKAELQALFKALGSARRGADVLDVA
jgi:hypothetical protein